VEQRIRPLRRRWPVEVYERAQEMVSETPTPTGADIADRLGKEFPENAPDQKTVRDWIHKGVIRPADRDRPWSIGDAEKPEDAALVFETILARATGPDPWPSRLYWPTVGQGAWIVRTRRAFPGLDDLVLVAHLAANANRGGDDLATSPWLDDGVALGEAVGRGLITRERGYRAAYLGGFGPDGYTKAIATAELRHRPAEKEANGER
jgi:hypothetical protein